FVHALASTLGLSVILAQSATAYNIVRLAGAGYLIYLGLRALWTAWRGSDTTGIVELTAVKPPRQRPLRAYFVEGALNNILNPKVAIFYLTFLPQFIDPSQGSVALQGAGLAAIHATQGVIWLFFCAYFVVHASAVMRRPVVRRRLEALTGLVLLGFGIRVALERR
ncbi:MAG TPA: LysE family translocator, partial [candidate division Zixibacteria bacterium]|nr:LysE family translocator [candidate division Zixibacteria bacterium]